MSQQSKSWKTVVALLFLLPNILGFLAFTIVPVGFSFGMSFTDWDILRHNIFREDALKFIWWDNFAQLFTHPQFWQYLGNTFFMMLGLPFAIAGSLAAALLLTRAGATQRNMKPAMIIGTVMMVGCGLMLLMGGMPENRVWFLYGMLAAVTLVGGVMTRGTLYRTMFFLPNFTAGVATYVLWKKLYNPITGPINQGIAPVLDGLTAWIQRMPDMFAFGVPILAVGLALLLGGWQIRRLVRSWDLSETGIVAMVAGLLVVWVPFGLCMTWLGMGGPLALGLTVFMLMATLFWITRRPQPWGRTKTKDKGLGTEVALALAVIPGLLLLGGMFVIGPTLPAAAVTGLEPPDWLGSYYWAKPALMIMALWAAIGSNNMILYLAGLSNISPELYEAADMDGATSGQRFWYITWPQLAPVTFFISIMSVIHGLQGGFEMARVMTLGGPAGSTTTLGYFIYMEGFETGRLGYASAVAWVLFAMVFALSVFNFRYGNRHVQD